MTQNLQLADGYRRMLLAEAFERLQDQRDRIADSLGAMGYDRAAVLHVELALARLIARHRDAEKSTHTHREIQWRDDDVVALGPAALIPNPCP